MARPKKTDTLDTTHAIELTMGSIDRLVCRTDIKAQAFLRDIKAPGLRVRVTNTGAKSFVFESKLNRQTIRRTIGDVRSWTIEQARAEARRLAVLLDSGQDPRALDREKQAQQAAEEAAQRARSVTVAEAWKRYLSEGKPAKKDAWKPRYRADLEAMASPGGLPKKRGKGVTLPGPLYPLMNLCLANVEEDVLKQWFDDQADRSRHQAARALRMFQGFLRWCGARKEYRDLADRDATKAPAIVESLPRQKRRTDALEAAQVKAWWRGAEQLSNGTASAYLRALLLTGARREELAALRWTQVDFAWTKLTLADKVESTRVIPLTPYLAGLLEALPRSGEFVFASTGRAGRLTDTRTSHAQVLKSAGLDHLTIHGLRRSFSLLGEAAGAPAGAIAQIMGHKPSATAEGYRPRSIDALRPFALQIEGHILKLAGLKPVVPEQQTKELET